MRISARRSCKDRFCKLDKIAVEYSSVSAYSLKLRININRQVLSLP